MLRIQFNNGAPLRLALPRIHQKQATIDLAETFVSYENTLPEAEQTPFTARIQAALDAARAAQAEAIDQEANRKAASEAFKRTQQAAKAMLRQMRSVLSGHFSQTPEQAQAWGFIVRQTGRSAGQILMPQTHAEILTCLNEYIEAETARPEAERFARPALADVITLRDDLVQQRQARNQARQLRLQENGRVESQSQELYEALRMALGYLVLVQFDGKPDRALAQWGFEVVARTPRPTREEEAMPEPEAEEEAPEPV